MEAGERAKRAEQPNDERGERAAAERSAWGARQRRDQQRTRQEEQDAQFDDQAGNLA